MSQAGFFLRPKQSPHQLHKLKPLRLKPKHQKQRLPPRPLVSVSKLHLLPNALLPRRA